MVQTSLTHQTRDLSVTKVIVKSIIIKKELGVAEKQFKPKTIENKNCLEKVGSGAGRLPYEIHCFSQGAGVLKLTVT